jgi:hypothetical protein
MPASRALVPGERHRTEDRAGILPLDHLPNSTLQHFIYIRYPNAVILTLQLFAQHILRSRSYLSVLYLDSNSHYSYQP